MGNETIFNDLFAYGKIEREVKDKENAAELEIKKGEIEFRNISFDYGKRSIFKNFNLKINKNEKIALVGHSGSGKSTLVKLLYRFYDVNSGEILIDGKNIKDFRQESLRGEMAIVPQECILFDDTVYNNITFSRPDSIHNDVIKAIKFSQLDKIIEKFPKKENTIVGERGIKLSGGEKQRVSIARAILADKKVLVLDEATSSLDSETEFEIQKDLQELMKGRTSIIIAHRLSTIMRADRIIVMKEGKIVQIGKHEDLINLEGEYKKLWNLQKGGYIK
ncbi:ATP-binding cassette domain-containing protein [Candidatus Woesearchaeota archaeon]|nr:ATP-binding cassette domain-containing protein [Candidatus Woesearchaeota archaeon]